MQTRFLSLLMLQVVNSIQTRWIQISINIALASHCFLATVLTINPMMQDLEDRFNVPFGEKRRQRRRRE